MSSSKRGRRELVDAALLDVRPGGDDQRVQRPVGGHARGQRGDGRAVGDVDVVGDDVRPPPPPRSARGGAPPRGRARRRRRRPARWRGRSRWRPGDQRGAAVERGHAQASRPAPARKTLTAAGGGPSASRANARARPPAGAPRPASPSEARPSPATRAPARSRPSCTRRSPGAELPAHDAVEAERRVVGGQADADQLPARAQQLERRRARGLRADGVEHEVGAEPRRRVGLAARRVAEGRVGAERQRALAPLRHAARGRVTCGMPDSSAACSVMSPIVPAPMTTARATGRRPARGARRARRWPAARPARRRARARRRAARARWPPARCTRSAKAPARCTPISVRSRAQVLLAGAAQPALAAAGERVDGDARALPLAGARARRDHRAGELVAHDQRRRAVAHVAEVALDLRAADARPPRAAGSARPRPGSAGSGRSSIAMRSGPCHTIAFIGHLLSVVAGEQVPCAAQLARQCEDSGSAASSCMTAGFSAGLGQRLRLRLR